MTHWSVAFFRPAGAIALVLLLLTTAEAKQPFLSTQQWNALRDAASGTAPYENLRYLTTLHRVPATAAFDQAAQFVQQKLAEYGLEQIEVEQYPADGSTQYGLMRSYLGWNVTSASLWQVKEQSTLLADWSTDPIRLADYSHSDDVQASLIDVGDGTHEADFANKDVRGKIVLADGVLSEVQRLAVTARGAAGIVSDMPNQSTAWSGLDPTLVRWGHLDARAPRGFAFMVSRATATSLRAQLGAGTEVLLHAAVHAAVVPGHWTVVTAIVRGTDANAGEIVFGCHLDHERPGANDNGSGCVTILESARILSRLIREGVLPRPARTLRFIWGPEVEGTMAYLSRHPDILKQMRAVVFMDMVGGDPFKNKSILHVTQTPWSLPSFVTDIGAAFASEIRDAAAAYAEGEGSAVEAVTEDRGGAPGTRNAFFVDETAYAEGSDHDDYDSSTIAVPALYLRDWPDIYIHTDHDGLQQIDATKLRRVALLGAASGYTYAGLQARDGAVVVPFLAMRAEQRLAQAWEQAIALLAGREDSNGAATYEAHNLVAQMLQRETRALESFVNFAGSPPGLVAGPIAELHAQAARINAQIDRVAHQGDRPSAGAIPRKRDAPDAARIPHRIGAFGPLTYQNDNVLLARLGAQRVAQIELLRDDSSNLTSAQQQRGALYAYEIINFVDGRRSVAQIRDAVAAEFGPLPLSVVVDYLKACVEARVIAYF